MTTIPSAIAPREVQVNLLPVEDGRDLVAIQIVDDGRDLVATVARDNLIEALMPGVLEELAHYRQLVRNDDEISTMADRLERAEEQVNGLTLVREELQRELNQIRERHRQGLEAKDEAHYQRQENMRNKLMLAHRNIRGLNAAIGALHHFHEIGE